MTWFAAFTCSLLFVAYGRHRTGVLASLAVCGGVAALTSPWWLSLIARDGIQPFVSAMSASDISSSNPLIVFISFRFTSELLFPLVSALGLLGAVVCVSSRRYVLPAWLLATAILDARSLGTVASVPLALLAAIAFTEVVLPIVLRRADDPAAPEPRATLPALAAGGGRRCRLLPAHCHGLHAQAAHRHDAGRGARRCSGRPTTRRPTAASSS
jgi:hypothetical protein